MPPLLSSTIREACTVRSVCQNNQSDRTEPPDLWLGMIHRGTMTVILSTDTIAFVNATSQLTCNVISPFSSQNFCMDHEEGHSDVV